MRATYEPLLEGLAAYLLLPLPGWMAEDADRDHWERGPRGTLARRLVDELMQSGAIIESELRQVRAGVACGRAFAIADLGYGFWFLKRSGPAKTRRPTPELSPIGGAYCIRIAILRVDDRT